MAMSELPGGTGGEYDEEFTTDSVYSEINITPLTDVFLVLLIIFMVTSTVITQSEVKVALPKAGAASSESKSKGVTVTLDGEGKLFVDKKEVSLDVLENLIKTRMAEGGDRSVILAGDYSVNLGKAMQILDLAKKSGAERFAIATKGDPASAKK